MKLWCGTHGTNHDVYPTDIKRIVYTLQAMLADAEGEPEVGGETSLLCPNEALRLSRDAEGYGEHVAATCERSLRAEKARTVTDYLREQAGGAS